MATSGIRSFNLRGPVALPEGLEAGGVVRPVSTTPDGGLLGVLGASGASGLVAASRSRIRAWIRWITSWVLGLKEFLPF